jgi:hypothetical protein
VGCPFYKIRAILFLCKHFTAEQEMKTKDESVLPLAYLGYHFFNWDRDQLHMMCPEMQVLYFYLLTEAEPVTFV